jgi:hypothetical protein
MLARGFKLAKSLNFESQIQYLQKKREAQKATLPQQQKPGMRIKAVWE